MKVHPLWLSLAQDPWVETRSAVLPDLDETCDAIGVSKPGSDIVATSSVGVRVCWSLEDRADRYKVNVIAGRDQFIRTPQPFQALDSAGVR